MNQLSKGEILKTGHKIQIKNFLRGMNHQVIQNWAEFETGKTVMLKTLYSELFTRSKRKKLSYS